MSSAIPGQAPGQATGARAHRRLWRRTLAAGFAAIVAVLGLVVVTQGQATAATPLGQLAAAKGKYFGSALAASRAAGGGSYTQLVGTEFNVVTPENEMKIDATEPNQGQFNFGPGDQIVSFAQAHNQRVRGHTLVWHSQLPNWLNNGNFNATQLRAIMQNHITTVMQHYAGKTFAWDVVNEAFNDDGTRRQSKWQTTLGDGYIADAFRFARAADPNAKLYINDFNTDGVNAKSTAIFNLASTLKSQGLLDGVGFQSHMILGQVPSTYQQNLQRFANLGLDVAITELDIRMNTPASSAMLQQQAGDYTTVVNACLAVSRCVGITTWGVGEPDSWIPGTFPGQGQGLLFDSNYQPKPAYNAVNAALASGTNPPPTSPPPTSPPPTSPPPTSPPPTSPPPTNPNASCSVNYVANSWATGFTTSVTIRNNSAAAINGWTLRFSFAGNQTVSNAWNAAPTQTGQAVSLTNLSYNSTIPPGGSTNMGFQAAYSGTNADPTAFSVNGTACSLF
jgi:endo-1,4-beta-xylanase